MADEPVLLPKPLLSAIPDAPDLQAIEALTGTGVAARTGTNTWALRTLTAGSGVSITNGDGASGNPTISATGSGGTVTSVGLSLPSIITVSGSPVTTSGTLTGTLATQTANTVFSGPTSGGAATPAFRALVEADVPNISAAKITSGTLDAARLPTHTHSAADITSGTLAVGRGGTGITTTPSNGFIPIGNGTNYTAAAITAGTGITVTNGSGSITIASSASVDNGTCQGRLAFASGTPVPTTNTDASTIVYTPYVGNRIALYSGGAWSVLTFSSASLDISALSQTPGYDVWAYNNSGTVTLDYTAWSSSTARSTQLAYQDGVLVKNGDATRRYIGSFYKSTATNTPSTVQQRYLWNYYNRVAFDMFSQEGGASHTYSTATWRQWNNSSSYRLEYFVGVLEDAPTFSIFGGVSGTGDPRISLAFNSTTSPTPSAGMYCIGTALSGGISMTARRGTETTLGYNYVTALQYTGSGTGTYDKLQLTGTVRC